MPSRAPPVYSDVFWRPLTEDVEGLLGRFQQTNSVRYEHFSAIWRDMAFSDVFRGIVINAEMKRFSRVALATAYKYFLPPYSYQIQVGGLYLMYAFYHTQLATPRVKIRLPLRAWHHVQKFLKDSVNSGQHDVVYILQKLIAAKAIHYTAMPHYLRYVKPRNPKQEPVCSEFIGRCKKVQELVSSDTLEEVANIQSRYDVMKKAVVEKSCHITMVRQDLPARLFESVLQFHVWQEKTFPAGEPDDRSSDEGSQNESSRKARLLESIKSRCYGTYQRASRARRNRQVETVDASVSGTEHQQGCVVRHRKRPPSLKARTCKKLKLGTSEERGNYSPWLLDVSEQDKIALNMALKRITDQDPSGTLVDQDPSDSIGFQCIINTACGLPMQVTFD